MAANPNWTPIEPLSDGWPRYKTGKLVEGDNGEVVDQIVVTPPPFQDAMYRYNPRPQPETATIYFIGPKDGPIKIGWASRLEFRLKDLRLANAYPLEVWASVEGPPKLEREYHKRFAEHRLHGEWFARAPEILAEIDRLAARLQPNDPDHQRIGGA